MTDYPSLKVAELHAALVARAVPFDKKLKKADLVRLLQENDAAQASQVPVASDPPAVPAVDADAAPVETAPAEADADVDAPAATPSARDLEIEKRKARAAKFGVPYVEPAAVVAPSTVPKASVTAPKVSATAPAESPEVLAKRRAKFGIPEPEKTNAPAPQAPVDPLIAEQARLDEEKKKAREARFNVQTVPAAKRHAEEAVDGAEPAEKKTKA